MDINEVKMKLQNVLKELEIDAELEVRGGSGYLYTPREANIVKTASMVLESIDVKPRIIELPGASDSRYFSPLGVECIDIGPIGGNIHGPNEWVNLESLRKLVEFYRRIPIALARK